jgi:hypothetical protein
VLPRECFKGCIIIVSPGAEFVKRSSGSVDDRVLNDWVPTRSSTAAAVHMAGTSTVLMEFDCRGHISSHSYAQVEGTNRRAQLRSRLRLTSCSPDCITLKTAACVQYARGRPSHGGGWDSLRTQYARHTALFLNTNHSCDLSIRVAANQVGENQGEEGQRCLGSQEYRPKVYRTTLCNRIPSRGRVLAG